MAVEQKGQAQSREIVRFVNRGSWPALSHPSQTRNQTAARRASVRLVIGNRLRGRGRVVDGTVH